MPVDTWLRDGMRGSVMHYLDKVRLKREGSFDAEKVTS
jgi:hypothetical protein